METEKKQIIDLTIYVDGKEFERIKNMDTKPNEALKKLLEKNVRKGWNKAFKKMRENNDILLIDDIFE